MDELELEAGRNDFKTNALLKERRKRARNDFEGRKRERGSSTCPKGETNCNQAGGEVRALIPLVVSQEMPHALKWKRVSAFATNSAIG